MLLNSSALEKRANELLRGDELPREQLRGREIFTAGERIRESA